MMGVILLRNVFFTELLSEILRNRPHWANVDFVVRLDRDRNGFIIFV